MPKAGKIYPQEMEEIIEKTAFMKATNPKVTMREIAEEVGRSDATILKVMSDKRFTKYMASYKKNIDSVNAKTMNLASKQLMEQVKQGKIKAYQLIGLLKVIGELTYPQSNPLFGGNNSTVNVQVVRHGVSHSAKLEAKEEE